MEYRVKVTVAGKRWTNVLLNETDAMMKIYIIQQRVFGIFWIEKDIVYSEFAARKELERLRSKQTKGDPVQFQDYILEEK